MPIPLILYGTEYCHLCEQAQAMLIEAALPWNDVDIAEDDALMARYGTRIPVLLRQDNGQELGWPFSGADVLRFVDA